MKALVRHLGPLTRPYRGSIFVGVTAGMAATGLSLAAPWAMGRALDAVAKKSIDTGGLSVQAAILGGLAIGVLAFGLWSRVALFRMSFAVVAELRQRMLAQLLRLPNTFHHGAHAGDLMSRVIGDDGPIQEVLGYGFLRLSHTILVLLGSLGFMAAMSPVLLAAVLIPLLLLPVHLWFFGRVLHQRFARVQEGLGALMAYVQSNLAGARVIRAYVQGPREIETFADMTDDYVHRRRGVLGAVAVLEGGVRLLTAVANAVFLGVGGLMVVRGSMTIGELLAFWSYLLLLGLPMMAFGSMAGLVERAGVSLGRMREVLDVVPEIADDPDAQILPETLTGHLSIRQLEAGYGDRPVLEGLDLDLQPGRLVAIVGATGSGKSTLANLLVRLSDPPPDRIFLEGVDIRRLPLAILRRHIALVPQEALLLSGTIAENIAFGVPASMTDADRERARLAADGAALSDELERFPAGLDTWVGEGGATLSGGQRQRVTIARALAAEPRVLVLDDALSAVDAETGRRILDHLRRRSEHVAVLLLSQRPDVARLADEVLVLAEGRVIERGPPSELEAGEGPFARLLAETKQGGGSDS